MAGQVDGDAPQAGGGVAAVTVRGVAADIGTTTRAVYSVFGSRIGLMSALAERAFDRLAEGVAAAPVTDDPEEDVVEAGLAFRRFALSSGALYGITFGPLSDAAWMRDPRVRAASGRALTALDGRLERLRAAGGLGRRTTREVFVPFNALCEGLAVMEIRGNFGDRPAGSPFLAEAVWRTSLRALLNGFAREA